MEVLVEAVATEPSTGLQFFELSHSWGHGIPVWPGNSDVKIERVVNHALHGVMAQKLTTSMQNGTHINAPDFVKVAESVGGHGERVTDPEKLQDALKRGREANQSGKAAIIDVIVA